MLLMVVPVMMIKRLMDDDGEFIKEDSIRVGRFCWQYKLNFNDSRMILTMISN